MIAKLVTAAKSGLQIVSRDAWMPPELRHMLDHWSPQTHLGRFVRECVLAHLPPEVAAELIQRFASVVVAESQLHLVRHRWDERTGLRVDDVFGIVSRKVVTDVGVAFIVDAWQNIVELEIQKYHGLGTGTNAEAAGDTTLQTELTTEYVGNTRATGTTTEGATGNIFRTVATITLDSGTPAVTEHGVFSAASSGTLFDRSKFSAINLVGANSDAITATYDATFTSGG